MPADIELTLEQEKRLQLLMELRFNRLSELDHMLSRTEYRLMHIVENNATVPTAIQNVIERAQARGWLRVLVQALYEFLPRVADVRDFVREVLPEVILTPDAAPLAQPDPLAAQFLGGGWQRAFIGRDELRSGLRALTDEGVTARVLTIHSDLRHCGKTYSAKFVKFYAMSRGDHVVYRDILQELTDGHSLEQVVREVGFDIYPDAEEFPTQQAPAKRWSQELVRWLTDCIKASNKFWWLVLDGIHQVPNLPSTVHEFIGRLAIQLELVEFDPPYRLVLISYPGRSELPDSVRYEVVNEVIAEPPQPAQVRDFVRNSALEIDGGQTTVEELEPLLTWLDQWVIAKFDALHADARTFAIPAIIRGALQSFETARANGGG